MLRYPPFRSLPRNCLAGLMLSLAIISSARAGDSKADVEAALAKAQEAATQAKEAADQARDAANHVKELTKQLEQTIKLAKEAVSLANEAATQAKQAASILSARDAAERAKEAKLEAARKAHEAELREAAAEEEAERKLHSDVVTALFEGKLTLFGPDKEKQSADVVGEFEHDKKKYLVKLGAPEVLKDLEPLDGKHAAVNAKIRNKGKYLVVMSVLSPGAAPTYTRRRGGL